MVPNLRNRRGSLGFGSNAALPAAHCISDASLWLALWLDSAKERPK
jgi:hypothetical protein